MIDYIKCSEYSPYFAKWHKEWLLIHENHIMEITLQNVKILVRLDAIKRDGCELMLKTATDPVPVDATSTSRSIWQIIFVNTKHRKLLRNRMLFLSFLTSLTPIIKIIKIHAEAEQFKNSNIFYIKNFAFRYNNPSRL